MHSMCKFKKIKIKNQINVRSSSSSPNNIQDQCLVITDIYDVREKGVWLGGKKGEKKRRKKKKKWQCNQ